MNVSKNYAEYIMENDENIQNLIVNYEYESIDTVIKSYLETLKNKDVRFILNVIENNIEYFFRVEGSLISKNCIIFYNGAVDIEKKDKPVFQRSSWVSDFESLVINIDDPTVRLRKDIVLGWGQGLLENYFSMNFDRFLQEILSSLIIRDTNRIHFGSSAGGYQAVIGSSLDKESRAIICNPQIDWTRHFFENHSNKIRDVSFKSYSIEALRVLYPERLNCLEMALKIGNIPNIDYYVNSAFTHDLENQLNYFMSIISSNRASMYTENKDINIHISHNKKFGHNPPDKIETIKYIKRRMIY